MAGVAQLVCFDSCALAWLCGALVRCAFVCTASRQARRADAPACSSSCEGPGMDDATSDVGSVASGAAGDVQTIVPPTAPWTQVVGADDVLAGALRYLLCALCGYRPSASSPYHPKNPKFHKYGGQWPWKSYEKV